MNNNLNRNINENNNQIINENNLNRIINENKKNNLNNINFDRDINETPEEKKTINKLTSKINNTISHSNAITPLYWVLPNKKEFPQWINETFIKYRLSDKPEKPIFINGAPTPFKYQRFLRDYMQNSSPYRGILLYHGLGSGKCHGYNTPILMYDGTIKMVQNIKEGEQLMGDDSKPRTVMSLARGRDKMYTVIQENGDSYIVNSEHILCLKDTSNYNRINEISVDMYLKLKNNITSSLMGYHVSVDFPPQQVTYDPYLCGYNVGLITVPVEYKINDIKIRLSFLAGYIDAHGVYNSYKNNIMILISSKTMIEDITFIARSVGFVVKCRPISSLFSNNGGFKLKIYGNFLQLPLKICKKSGSENKLSEIRTEYKNYLLEKIKIKYIGVDNYYGFMLSGNGRYLLGDFTVTHNTCTTLTITENLKTNRNIVVMLPASLKNNFINEGLLYCADKEYKINPQLYNEKYNFISYNANNTPTQLKRIGTLDNKVIVIEEAHNLVSKMVSGIMGVSKHGKYIYDALMSAQNVKIIALSGTPLINDPFELAVLFNVLRGYIEITYFSIVRVDRQYGNTWELSTVEKELLKNKYIDYIDINKITKMIEFHITVKSYAEEYQKVINEIFRICTTMGVEVKYNTKVDYSLFPISNDGDDFRASFVEDKINIGEKLINGDIFKRRIMGLISYYTPLSIDLPTIIRKDYYRVEMSYYQYIIYELLRIKERKTEKGQQKTSGKKRKTKEAVKSTFRVFSRQACNFVFPESINRPYPDPSFIVNFTQFGKKEVENKREINKYNRMEEEEKENVDNEYKTRIQRALSDLILGGDIYLKPGKDGLNKLSPKMNKLLENMNDTNGLILIYSTFRTLEGVEIFSQILKFNGYADWRTSSPLPKFAIHSGLEDQQERAQIIKLFTSLDNLHGELIKILLITSSAAEGLDLKAVRQIHIMEPYWNQMRIDQVIGRGVRRNSHIMLPPEERNVSIYRYFSTLPKNTSSHEQLSTDEHIEHISMKKQSIIDDLKLAMKEAAFDCVLNSSTTKPTYPCFSYGTDAHGMAYMPSIKRNIITIAPNKETKKVKIQLLKGIYNNGLVYIPDIKTKKFYLYDEHTQTKKKYVDINIKGANMIYINPNNNYVFDKKSVEAGNPIKIGVIKNNKIFKK